MNSQLITICNHYLMEEKMALGSKKMKVGWFWEKNPIIFFIILAAFVGAVFYLGIIFGNQDGEVTPETVPNTEVQANE